MKEVKDEKIEIRLTKSDKRLFTYVAGKEGVSLSEYIRRVLRREANSDELARLLKDEKYLCADEFKGGD